MRRTVDGDAAASRPWWRPRWRTVLSWVAVATALLLVYLLGTLWFVYRTGDTDQARPVDAIVVMGAAQYDGRPSPQLAARLDHVVELWRRDLADIVVTTGGNRPGDRFTEAQASADYLVAHGVPRDAIVEVGGSTSYGSLVAARDAVVGLGRRSVLLVSDPYHSLRIRLVAQELGLIVPMTEWAVNEACSQLAQWQRAGIGFIKAAGGHGGGADADAARARGFDRPVAQGGILNGFVSHFVGMIFPGDRSLLLSVDLRYLRPNWHGDRLRLQASVRQKVDSARVCVVAIVFRNLTQGDLVTARGLMQVRFIA